MQGWILIEEYAGDVDTRVFLKKETAFNATRQLLQEVGKDLDSIEDLLLQFDSGNIDVALAKYNNLNSDPEGSYIYLREQFIQE